MKLPFKLEPKDLLVAAVSIVGWVATAAYWTANTDADRAAQARTLQEHTATLATHDQKLAENSLWHATRAAHSDQDRQKFNDHEARLRTVEERIALIPVMANDVSWIKSYLSMNQRQP